MTKQEIGSRLSSCSNTSAYKAYLESMLRKNTVTVPVQVEVVEQPKTSICIVREVKNEKSL